MKPRDHSIFDSMFKIGLVTFAVTLGSKSIDMAQADILYVSYSFNGNIVRFNSSGAGSVFVNRGSGFIPGGDLAFDRDGYLFARNLKFTPSGVGSVFFNQQSTDAIAFDSSGNLYAANQADNTIQKYTPSGVGTTFASTGLNQPLDLAFDKNGNLFVANKANNSIERFTPDGIGSVYASGGLIDLPQYLAFDSTGNLFVSESQRRRIVKITADGVMSIFASFASGPSGLAFDSAGNLYTGITDTQNSSHIEKITPSGVRSIFTTTTFIGPLSLAFTDDSGEPLLLPNQVPEPRSAIILLGFGGSFLLTRLARQSRSKALSQQ